MGLRVWGLLGLRVWGNLQKIYFVGLVIDYLQNYQNFFILATFILLSKQNKSQWDSPNLQNKSSRASFEGLRVWGLLGLWVWELKGLRALGLEVLWNNTWNTSVALATILTHSLPNNWKINNFCKRITWIGTNSWIFFKWWCQSWVVWNWWQKSTVLFNVHSSLANISDWLQFLGLFINDRSKLIMQELWKRRQHMTSFSSCYF